jgi:hypothetical protein
MKTLFNYIKYLTTKPVKILWLVVVNILVQIIGFCVFSGDVYTENGSLVMWALGIFITAIFVVANLQPYYEWQDGLEKPKK